MESINFFKGYGKVNPVEDQSSTSNHRNAQKRRITVVISLIVLVTVIIGAMIGALMHESITEPPESSSSLSAKQSESIRAVCSVTRYPDSCFTTISSLNATTSNNENSSPCKTDPEHVFSLSLQVAINELTNLSSLPKTLISKSNDPRAESALRDCVGLFDDALSQLKESASSMDVGPGEKVLTEAKIGDMRTWISSAMTDQETCLDGLGEMGSTVLDEAKAKVQKSSEYMSNSLAILANMQSLLDKFGLPMH